MNKIGRRSFLHLATAASVNALFIDDALSSILPLNLSGVARGVWAGYGAHRYWRIRFPSSPSTVSIRHLVFRERPGGPNVCVGGVPFADGQVAAHLSAENAFDGNDVTKWEYNAGTWKHIGYDFGAGNEKSIAEIGIANFGTTGSGGESNNNAPTSFSVQYSDDNTNWSTAWSHSSLTQLSWPLAAIRPFTAPDAVPVFGNDRHRYWRVRFTGTSTQNLNLEEIQFRETVSGANVATPSRGVGPLGSDGGGPAANAFNADPLKKWGDTGVLTSTQKWIGYEFPADNPINIASFGVLVNNISDCGVVFEHSDDFITWTAVLTLSATGAAAQIQWPDNTLRWIVRPGHVPVYPFGMHRYWRINYAGTSVQNLRVRRVVPREEIGGVSCQRVTALWSYGLPLYLRNTEGGDNVINGDGSSSWGLALLTSGHSASGPRWIGWQTPPDDPANIKEVMVALSQLPDPSTVATLQWSDDFVSWTTAFTMPSQPISWSGVFEGHFTNTSVVSPPVDGRHRFWRLYFVGSSLQNLSLSEVLFASTAGGLPLHQMHPTAFPISGSAVGMQNAANCFDGNISTTWGVTPSTNSGDRWVGLVFSPDEPVRVEEFGIRPANTSYPTRFRIQYSDDFLTWTTQREYTSQSSGWSVGVLRRYSALPL